jgi:hypothetical protein
MAGYTAQPPAGSPYPSFAGHLVELDNITLTNPSATTFGTTNITMTLTDTGSHTMAGFYNPTTYSLPNANLFGQTVPSGPVNATGLIQIFQGAPELLLMSLTPVPEPSTLVLGAGGLIALIGYARRRARLIR